MRFLTNLHQFWRHYTNQSEHLIKNKSLWTEGERAPINIEYKLHLNASELTSNQQIINSVVKKLITHDSSKRQYAGRSDNELMRYKKQIYQYESYQTQNVKLVPNHAKRLDVYVEDIYLGKLPQEYTKEAVRFLQSAIFMAFAFVKGGPYKYYDEKSEKVKEGSDPYDLNIYFQFS